MISDRLFIFIVALAAGLVAGAASAATDRPGDAAKSGGAAHAPIFPVPVSSAPVSSAPASSAPGERDA